MVASRQRLNGFALAVAIEGGLALVAVVLAGLFGLRLREQMPEFGPPLTAAVVRGVAVTLPMLAVFFALVHSSQPGLVHLRQQVTALIGEMFPAASLGQFLLIALLAGVGEEALFRGVMQSLIGQWTSPVAGLVLTSLAFGMAHALSKLYFALATLIGLCFGWLVLQYNDLVAPMVAHSLYDFVALVYISRLARLDHEETSDSRT